MDEFRLAYEQQFLNKRCLKNLNTLIRLALRINKLLKQGYVIIDNTGDLIKQPYIFEHDTYGNFRVFGNLIQMILWPKSEYAKFEPEEVEWCQYDEATLKKVFFGYKVYTLKEVI